MKKTETVGLLVWLIVMAISVIAGVFIIKEYTPLTEFSTLPFILIIAASLIVGVLFNSFMYEQVHKLGAKIGGYYVVSSTVLMLCTYKENGKKKRRFTTFDGLTGETKITPKSLTKSNPIPYLLGGTIFYAIELVVIIFAFNFLKLSEEHNLMDIAYPLLIIAVTGGAILLYNIMPFKLDSKTDGYCLRLISTKDGVVEFNKMLLAENGNRLDEPADFNEEKVVDPNAEKYSKNTILNELFLAYEAKNYAKAEQIAFSKADEELNSKAKEVSFDTFLLKSFTYMFNHSTEENMSYYEKEFTPANKRALGEEKTINGIKTYVLVSGLLDKAKYECALAINRVEKALKRIPESQRELEKELVNLCIDRVLNEHPKWELEKIK